MPFRRIWPAIIVLAVMDGVFMFPAVTTFKQAVAEWGQFDSLFDLVGALFLSAWLLGWIIGPILMTSILLLMLFGREVVKASPGGIEIFIGLPLLGVTSRYDVSKMRNLRFERPPKKSGKAWRGPHLSFDYGANTVAFGSSIGAGEVDKLRHELQVASGAMIRRGDALPAELHVEADVGALDKSPSPLTPANSASRNLPVSLTSSSTLLLIIANLVPIAGSVFFGWNLADVMVLYWAESAIIGFFNVCKIIVIGHWAALLAGPFFVGHFGGFMVIHFLFIYTIFIEQPIAAGTSGGEISDVVQLFIDLWPALAALFVSHAFSFRMNFLGRKEYRGRSVNDQMSEPYRRIIFMHMVLIIGGGLTMVLGSPALILPGIIALKTYFDVKAHMKQHAGKKP
jgi:hypothetical protein